MLKNYIFLLTLGMLSPSAHCMEITAKISSNIESYTKQKERFIRIALFDKTQGTYSAVKYWDADCITNEPNPKEIFLKLKSAYQAQEQQQTQPYESSKELL